MEDKYRHTNTTVSLINYHFVICPRLSNVKLFKGYLAKLIGDIFDCYDLIINLFGDQCQII